jgi:hypothetical protein
MSHFDALVGHTSKITQIPEGWFHSWRDHAITLKFRLFSIRFNSDPFKSDRKLGVIDVTPVVHRPTCLSGSPSKLPARHQQGFAAKNQNTDRGGIPTFSPNRSNKRGDAEGYGHKNPEATPADSHPVTDASLFEIPADYKIEQSIKRSQPDSVSSPSPG